jgi:hypothetical protein
LICSEVLLKHANPTEGLVSAENAYVAAAAAAWLMLSIDAECELYVSLQPTNVLCLMPLVAAAAAFLTLCTMKYSSTIRAMQLQQQSKSNKSNNAGHRGNML